MSRKETQSPTAAHCAMPGIAIGTNVRPYGGCWRIAALSSLDPCRLLVTVAWAVVSGRLCDLDERGPKRGYSGYGAIYARQLAVRCHPTYVL